MCHVSYMNPSYNLLKDEEIFSFIALSHMVIALHWWGIQLASLSKMSFPREIVAKIGNRALRDGTKLLHTRGFLEQPIAGGNCCSSENS